MSNPNTSEDTLTQLASCRKSKMRRKRSRPIMMVAAIAMVTLQQDAVSAESTETKYEMKANQNDMIKSNQAPKLDSQVSRNLNSQKCRCQYPGEELNPLNEGKKLSPQSVLKNHEIILLENHPACKDIVFFCPGEQPKGTPWSYDCTAELQTETGDGRRTQLRGQRHLEHKIDFFLDSDHQQAQKFVHMMDDNPSESSTFIVLPDDFKSCSTEIEKAKKCTNVKLNFAKAADGRPMEGGMFVANEWFHNAGVKISGAAQNPSHNVHPMIFDTEHVVPKMVGGDDTVGLGSPNFAFGGPGVGHGGYIGQIGENCDYHGKALMPAKRDGSPSEPTEYGTLTFDFYKSATVHNMSFLNVLDTESRIVLYMDDGSKKDIYLMSVGENGFQTLAMNLSGITKLEVEFHSLAAIVEMDLCAFVP